MTQDMFIAMAAALLLIEVFKFACSSASSYFATRRSEKLMAEYVRNNPDNLIPRSGGYQRAYVSPFLPPGYPVPTATLHERVAGMEKAVTAHDQRLVALEHPSIGDVRSEDRKPDNHQPEQG